LSIANRFPNSKFSFVGFEISFVSIFQIATLFSGRISAKSSSYGSSSEQPIRISFPLTKLAVLISEPTFGSFSDLSSKRGFLKHSSISKTVITLTGCQTQPLLNKYLLFGLISNLEWKNSFVFFTEIFLIFYQF